MNILVIHSHNANRGDEAAVKAMVDELLYMYPSANITISNNGFVPYPNMPECVKQIERFPKLQSKIAQLDFFVTCLTKSKIVLTSSTKEFIRELKKADVVLHAPGGPSIGDTYLKAEKLYLWRLDFIRKMGVPYIFYAPSMGPFENKERNELRKKVLRGAERIVVRDPISLQYVNEFVPEVNVELALDSAFQHDVCSKKNEIVLEQYPELEDFLEKHKKCIGVTITDLKWHPKHKTEEIINNIPDVFNQFVDKKISEGYGIIFIPQLYGNLDDTTLMGKFMRPEHTFMVDAFSEQRDTYFQQYLIGKLYGVVGMRYHSNIFSAKMGIPFVSISYEQKMKGFMQLMKLDNYCIDISELTIDALLEKFTLLENTYVSYKNKLNSQHSFMKKEAFKSSQVVIDYFERKNIK